MFRLDADPHDYAGSGRHTLAYPDSQANAGLHPFAYRDSQTNAGPHPFAYRDSQANARTNAGPGGGRRPARAFPVRSPRPPYGRGLPGVPV